MAGKPEEQKTYTEQAKEAIGAAGQKAAEAWEGTKQKASEVSYFKSTTYYSGIENVS
jgi:hypothetical protein